MRVYDGGVEGDTYYLIMDLIEDLGGYIVQKHIIAAEVVLQCFVPKEDIELIVENLFRERFIEEKNKRIIESHLERFFGKALVVGAGEAATGGPAAAGGPGAAAEPGLDLSGESPMLGRLVEEFDGKIVADDGDDRRAGE